MDKKDALLIFQFSHILWSLLYIFITIFIAYIISKKDINKFVKGVFIIIPIFYSISNLLEILAFYMDIESIRSFFYYNKEYKQSVLNFIPVFSVSLSYFLMITGITFLLFSKQENNTRTDIKLIGRRRKIGLSLLLFIITLGLYFPFWLYRIVKDLKTNFNNEVPYTPTQALHVRIQAQGSPGTFDDVAAKQGPATGCYANDFFGTTGVAHHRYDTHITGKVRCFVKATQIANLCKDC